jgi:hypothetical protein
MEKVFITLFTLLISVTTFTNLNSQELRMSISGIYNGETKETIEEGRRNEKVRRNEKRRLDSRGAL